MERYSIEPITRKYVKGYGYLSFVRNLYNKYRKHLLNTAIKTGLDALKAATTKETHKAADEKRSLINL